MRNETIRIECHVTVDTNDADFVTMVTTVQTERQLSAIKRIAEAVAGFREYEGESADGWCWTHKNNFPYGESQRADLGEKGAEELYGHIEGFDMFVDSFLPQTEYGFHCIKSIVVKHVSKEDKLL